MDSKSRFNRFYESEDLSFGDVPTPALKDYVESNTVNGDVLDLGCGDGRNALYMAKRGLRVTAVDTSDVGIKKMMEVAEGMGLGDRIIPICADIVEWEFPKSMFGFIIAITIFDHLQPENVIPTFEKTVQSMSPNGYLFAKAHTIEDPGYKNNGKSSGLSDMINYYFSPDELLNLTGRYLKIINYTEKSTKDETHGEPHYHAFAEVLARK
ncbi:MAG: methyltransferase domain-containing protein [candidate division Zixibacteria bacterium]|nr:methyltransferase domain-containing protein [candidate division Zixibacteria bacterium]